MRSRISVHRVLNPRSIAVIGASDNKSKFGGRVMHYLVRHKFGGAIYPVNPKRDKVLGIAAYPSIKEVPDSVDVAMLAVPPSGLAQAVKDSAEAGVGCCVIMTTGFAEADAEGAAAQAQLVAIARGAGMRIVGPNCMGLINPLANCALSSSLVLEVDELPRGRIGLISQSGALMVSMFNKAQDAGIGFSASVSLGNQSDLEICDFLEFLIDDADTEAICLYVEGFVAPKRFLALAERCEKPLLMVKTGRTPDGARAAKSHTASLAGSYETLQAACRDLGVILMDDPDGMIRAADAVVRWPHMTGSGIAILSPSGGGAAVAVDRVSESRLELARLTDATRSKLLEVLLAPQADNPVDLGGRRDGDSLEAAASATAILAGDPNVAALLVVLTTVPDYEATTRMLAEAAIKSAKPAFFVVTPGSAADGPRRALSELRCSWFDELDQALRVMKAMMERGRNRRATPPSTPVRPDGLPHESPQLPAGSGQLTEPEVKALLKRYRIPVTRENLVTSETDAIAAAGRLGYPVALKVVSREIIHKSDAGGVRVGIGDTVGLSQALREMSAQMEAIGAPVEGYLVQEMISGEAELIVGIRHDEQFGPVVVVGFGGLYVEILKDIQLALAPVTSDQAVTLLRRLTMWRVLAGIRGRPPLDVDALAEIVSRLSWLAVDLGGRLMDLELNPVIVRTKGGGAVAVDARATLSSAEATENAIPRSGAAAIASGGRIA